MSDKTTFRGRKAARSVGVKTETKAQVARREQLKNTREGETIQLLTDNRNKFRRLEFAGVFDGAAGILVSDMLEKLTKEVVRLRRRLVASQKSGEKQIPALTRRLKAAWVRIQAQREVIESLTQGLTEEIPVSDESELFSDCSNCKSLG